MVDVAGGVNVGALIASLGLDTTAYMAGMTAAETRMQKASANLAATGAKMAKIGRKMTMGLTLPILGMGVAAFKAQKDFEASMSKIIGLVGVAETTVKSWEKSILALGPAVGKGPEELADAMFFIASAGIRGAEALDVLEMSAKASAAGLGETKVVADLVTSAMNAYGKENLSAAMATDILTAAVREGKAEADQLAGAMGLVLPIAAEMGVSFDQVGAGMAAMTRTGTNASIAATQLKQIMSSMLKPTVQSAEAMAQMGFSAASVRKTIREDGLIVALEDIRKTTNKFGEEAMSKVFPNIRALMGVLDLMGKNAEDNIQIFDSLTNATGSLDAAFAAASKTTQFEWDQALAQIKTTFTKVGMTLKSSIIPLIEKVTDRIKEITEKFEALDDAGRQNVIRLMAITAAIGPLILVVGKLFTMLATNPWAVAALAITVATVAIVKFAQKNKDLMTATKLMNGIQGDANQKYAEQKGKLEELLWVANNEKISLDERKKAVDELNRIMPTYNGHLEDQTGNLRANDTALTNYMGTLMDVIKLEVFRAAMVDLQTKKLQETQRLNKALVEQKRAQDALALAPATTIVQPGFSGIGAQGVDIKPKKFHDDVNAATTAVATAQNNIMNLGFAVVQLQNDMEGLNWDLLTPTAAKGGGGGGGGGAGAGGTGGGVPLAGTDAGVVGITAVQSGTALLASYADLKKQEQQIFQSTERAKIMAMSEGAAKEMAIETQRHLAARMLLEQKAIEFPELNNTINAQIEAEAEAHAKRLEAIDAAAQGKIKQTRIESANQWIKNAAAALNAIGNLIEAQKQRELSAAGDSAKKREQIEKKFFRKQQAMAVAQAIINGALAITNMIATVPGSVINPATWVGIGIAGAATAAQVGIIASQKFADGGLAYGPTMGMVGEYPGARSNPEVIAPLNKLQTIIGNRGDGGGRIEVEKISGEDIYLVYKRFEETLNRAGKVTV